MEPVEILALLTLIAVLGVLALLVVLLTRKQTTADPAAAADAAARAVTDALRREVREEIGLTDFTPEHICTYIFESARDRELVYVFKTTTDETPTPSAELAGGAFFSAEEIKQRMNTGFFTPNFESEYQRCFGE